LHTFEGTLEAGWKRVLSGRPKVACLIVEPYPMSAVLIIGASSGIGYDTVTLALKEGHSVRAMARSANAIRLDDPKLEKLESDALDQDAIERALAGIEAASSAAPACFPALLASSLT
jgi:NAD(P)-dependent dehydrogenase (short-subunit alcohol dehydrogenase family)